MPCRGSLLPGTAQTHPAYPRPASTPMSSCADALRADPLLHKKCLGSRVEGCELKSSLRAASNHKVLQALWWQISRAFMGCRAIQSNPARRHDQDCCTMQAAPGLCLLVRLYTSKGLQAHHREMSCRDVARHWVGTLCPVSGRLFGWPSFDMPLLCSDNVEPGAYTHPIQCGAYVYRHPIQCGAYVYRHPIQCGAYVYRHILYSVAPMYTDTSSCPSVGRSAFEFKCVQVGPHVVPIVSATTRPMQFFFKCGPHAVPVVLAATTLAHAGRSVLAATRSSSDDEWGLARMLPRLRNVCGCKPASLGEDVRLSKDLEEFGPAGRAGMVSHGLGRRTLGRRNLEASRGTHRGRKQGCDTPFPSCVRPGPHNASTSDILSGRK
eukprot:365046-Chlamydomonas_euryale.AAC.2